MRRVLKTGSLAGLLVLFLIVLAGCAGSAQSHETGGSTPPASPPTVDDGEDAGDSPSQNRPVGRRSRPGGGGQQQGEPNNKPFMGTEAMTSDPSMVDAATGAGDVLTFSGEVITLVVNPGRGNASDDNTGAPGQPLKTIGRAVELMQERATRQQFFHLKIHAGEYHELVQIQGVKGRGFHLLIEGIGDVIITGAERATDWTPMGNRGRFSHPWPNDWGTYFETEAWQKRKASIPADTRKWLMNAGGEWHRREAVFVEGEPVRQVLSAGDLKPGTFYADEANDRLILHPAAGVDPRQVRVDVPERLGVFRLAGAENVTLRNLTFRYAATYTNWALAQVSKNTNLLIEDCRFERGSFSGLQLDGNTLVTLRRVDLYGNGGKGAAMGGNTDLLLEDCTASRNNWRGHWAKTYGWDLAGIKAVFNRHVMVRRLEASNNFTTGLWFDLDNVNITVEDCDLHDNVLAGLFLEAGRGPILVRDCRMSGNTTNGVLITNAERITLRGNTIRDNAKGQVFVRAYGREIKSKYANVTEAMWSRHVSLYDNIIESTDASQPVWLTDMSKSNLSKSLSSYTGNGNTWIHPEPGKAFQAMGARHSYQDWVQWTGEGERSKIRNAR